MHHKKSVKSKLSKVERKYSSGVSNDIVKISNRFDLLTNEDEDDMSKVVKKVGENKFIGKVVKELQIKDKLYNIEVIIMQALEVILEKLVLN